MGRVVKGVFLRKKDGFQGRCCCSFVLGRVLLKKKQGVKNKRGGYPDIFAKEVLSTKAPGFVVPFSHQKSPAHPIRW